MLLCPRGDQLFNSENIVLMGIFLELNLGFHNFNLIDFAPAFSCKE